MIKRKITKKIMVGGVPLGGGSRISVQSMLNVPADQVEKSVEQALALEKAGCDIVRIAVPNREAVRLVYALKSVLSIPVVADIHFDYRLALEAAAAGVDKIRINPGNIGDEGKVKAVADTCRQREIPIRIGVNSGSLEKEILAKYGHPTPEALRDSALYHASLLEKYDFTDIVLSMKSSHVPTMVRAYQLASQACDYPLHLGVTEAGTERIGAGEILGRYRRLAAGGRRRHHTGVPDRRPGQGNLCRKGLIEGAGDRNGRNPVYFLSHLRENENRPDRLSKSGAGGFAGL